MSISWPLPIRKPDISLRASVPTDISLTVAASHPIDWTIEFSLSLDTGWMSVVCDPTLCMSVVFVPSTPESEPKKESLRMFPRDGALGTPDICTQSIQDTHQHTHPPSRSHSLSERYLPLSTMTNHSCCPVFLCVSIEFTLFVIP